MNTKELGKILSDWNRHQVIEDRSEYDVEMIMSSNPGLSKEEATWLWVELRMRYFEGMDVLERFNDK